MHKLGSTNSSGTFGPWKWEDIASSYFDRSPGGSPAVIYIKITAQATVHLKGSPTENEQPLPIATYTESTVAGIFACVKWLWIEVEVTDGNVEVWFDGGG